MRMLLLGPGRTAANKVGLVEFITLKVLPFDAKKS